MSKNLNKKKQVNHSKKVNKKKHRSFSKELDVIVKRLKQYPGVDFPLCAITVALIIFGVIMVSSASYYWSMDKFGSTYGYLIKSSIWAVAGGLIMYVCSYIDYHVYRKWYRIVMVISVVLLCLIFTPLGHEVGGATRWLDFKVITLMPGEIAKIAAIIFTAGFLSRRNIDDFKGTILPLLALCGVYGGLIMMQPNMSTAVTVVMIICAMMFIAGLDMKYVVTVLIAGVVLCIPLAMADYRMHRVLSFLDPFEDPLGISFQVVQSLMALGSGGLFGKGLGNSVQKNLYLPEPMNDFILAIIGEELGYIGILLLIATFCVLIWRGIKVAMNAPDRFGFYLASGVIVMIGIQFAMNIAIVTSSMPPTGIALPFISYGGNAMMIFCAGMGIVLNISRQGKLKANKEKLLEAERERIIVDKGRNIK